MVEGRDRRQRWAAFSVRAHRDLAALATDILLYDRIILPVPEDDTEYDRWVRRDWAPDEIPRRVIQSAYRIIPVPWTAELRGQWKTEYDRVSHLGEEVAYGMTGQIYASAPSAWDEIYASVWTDQKPERKPFLIAGYQSEREATAALALQPAPSKPGQRPVDLAVALHVRRIVEEPDIAEPFEAFLASVKLAEDPTFDAARRRLFDWEDALYVDDWDIGDIVRGLDEIEEEYNQAVRQFARQTRKRRVASLLPGVVGGWSRSGVQSGRRKGGLQCRQGSGREVRATAHPQS